MLAGESDLFKDLGEQAMNEISKIMILESYNPGSVIYTERDRADYFYILWEGRVRLSIGKEAEIDYTVSRRGESFGWSSLVDRERYTARAEALEPTKIYKIDKNQLNEIFRKMPEVGALFYKRLAGAVVQRLIYNYEAFLSVGSLRGVTSFGTGQVMASAEE